MKKPVYFDNAATTPVDNVVLEKYIEYQKKYYANPSSIHKLGLKTKEKLSQARENISRIMNCKSSEIFFTSSGSESNNLVLRNYKSKYKEKNKIISFSTEHASVFNTLKISEKEIIFINPPTEPISFKHIEKYIDKNVFLISIMLVNNETGIINNIQDISKNIKKKYPNIKIHVDGVQGFLKIPVDLKKLNIDFFTTSSHKNYCPKGVSILYKNQEVNLIPLITGGNQEFGLRSGTENLPCIMTYSYAATLFNNSLNKNFQYISNLKKYLLKQLSLSNVKYELFSNDFENFSPYIINLSIDGLKSEILVRLLGDENIMTSPSSACSSKESRTRVLSAYGKKSKYIDGALRISFGIYNSFNEIDYFIEKLKIIQDKYSF